MKNIIIAIVCILSACAADGPTEQVEQAVESPPPEWEYRWGDAVCSEAYPEYCWSAPGDCLGQRWSRNCWSLSSGYFQIRIPPCRCSHAFPFEDPEVSFL